MSRAAALGGLMAVSALIALQHAAAPRAASIPNGGPAENYHYRILTAPNSGDERAFRTTFHQYAQGRSDGLFNALHTLLGGDTPQLNFVHGIPNDGGLSQVHLSANPAANAVNVDPYAVEGIIDNGSAIHSGAVNQLPHEMAHLRQTTATVPDREGGAQAFADIVTPTAAQRAGIPYRDLGFDGLYAAYVKQAQAKGRDWILAGQFGKPGTPAWP